MGHRTLIMGVLNVTPDSFYDGGRYFELEKAVVRGMQIEEEGADILDIGGESTRPPRSRIVASSEEIKRVVPVIERLGKRLTIPISIDTTKSEVAKAGLAAGAQIVNDIAGFRFDADMPAVIAASKAAVILMHSRGTPESMHNLRRVRDVVRVVIDGLHRSVYRAVEAGIHRNRIIVDPGLGFGKQAEESLLLLKKLDKLRTLKLPVLVGASRKSFVGKILNLAAGERLLGSLACAALAIVNGAHILRVHDVKETLQVAKICDTVISSSRHNP
jgi:dihydropteroate synthase